MTSDGGFGSIARPGQAAAQQNLGRGGTALQILRLPDTLNNNPQAVRLPGQITQVNANGSIRIATPEGNIDAQVRNTNSLQTGQQIDVEIPAGRPPQQATLRPSSVQTPTPENRQTNAQQNSAPVDNRALNRAASDNASAAARGATTTTTNTARPEQRFLTPNNAQTTQATPERVTSQVQNPAPLQQAATVRLIAIPPAQAQQIATQSAQALTALPTSVNTAPVTANIIAENVQTQILNSALQTTQTAAPTPQVTQATNSLQNLLNNTALNQSLQTPALSQNVNLATPVTQSAAQQNASNVLQFTTVPLLSNPAQPLPLTALTPQDIATPLIQNLSVATPQNAQVTGQGALQQTLAQPLQQPISTSLTPAQVTFDPTNPASVQNTPLGRIDIQIVAIQPPQANITAPLQAGQPAPQIIPATTNFTPPIVNTNNNAVTITAQVTGFTAQGLPLVTLPPIGGRTISQSYVLQFNSNNVQLGTQLQITTQNPVLAAQAQTTPAVNPLLRGFQWPAINQLYNTLFQINPQAATSLTNTLPTLGNPAQTASAAMLFIAAVKSGDITQFLGQNKTEMIQRAGRENILRALSQDSGTQTARGAEAPTTNEWRAVPLPMFWQNEIHKITLYTRHENEKNNDPDNEGNDQTRFVFDLNLTRMGDMQIDGYLKEKRLDLIVRAQNMFSSPMQQAMRQAYSNALDHTDLSGELNFQGSTKNWVHVLEQNEQLGVDV